MVLNTAARLLLRIPKFGHISSAIINTLHWLPVPDRLTFKICCLVWNSVVGAGPSYLRELCTWSSVGSGRVLRSSTSSFLKVPFCRSATTHHGTQFHCNFVCCLTIEDIFIFYFKTFVNIQFKFRNEQI